VRRYVWTAIGIISVLLLAGAIQLRLDAQADGDPVELHKLVGVTGQRQPIEFQVDQHGRPHSLDTELYNHCPDWQEWSVRWYPSNGSPIPFRLRGDRLTVREEGENSYDRGRTGSGTITMAARLTEEGIEGRIRSVWRFSRNGKEYAVCDTGNVPFAVGERARERLVRVPRSGEPWSLYPEAPEITARRSVDRFARRVDATCGTTWHQIQACRRSLARTIGRHPKRAKVLRRQYLALHVGQFKEVLRVGPPPAALSTYEPWIRNFSTRLHLERDQIIALERGDLDAAGRVAARLAIMKARGNALGLRFGLDTCTSNGPTGAANVL
jgi:hypothetical protein